MSTQARFRRAENVVSQELEPEDGAVLLHIDTGFYHGLNPVGTRIWELLEEPRSEEELGDLLADEFGIERSVILSDVRAFLEGLHERQLVVRDSDS